MGAQNRLVGATNYPPNLGLNRRINAAPPGTMNGNWKQNGPVYILSDWDGANIGRTVTINSFIDGTSMTAIFSEWVKGPGSCTKHERARNGLQLECGRGHLSDRLASRSVVSDHHSDQHQSGLGLEGRVVGVRRNAGLFAHELAKPLLFQLH